MSPKYTPIAVELAGNRLRYVERRRMYVVGEMGFGGKPPVVFPPDAITGWEPPFSFLRVTEPDRDRIRRNISSWFFGLGDHVMWMAHGETGHDGELSVPCSPRGRWRFSEEKSSYSLLGISPGRVGYEEIRCMQPVVDRDVRTRLLRLPIASVERWFAPYEDEPVTDSDRERIVANITRLLGDQQTNVVFF